jgi:hypothetical protein
MIWFCIDMMRVSFAGIGDGRMRRAAERRHCISAYQLPRKRALSLAFFCFDTASPATAGSDKPPANAVQFMSAFSPFRD